jgi:AcrR family transcriptional regulator
MTCNETETDLSPRDGDLSPPNGTLAGADPPRRQLVDAAVPLFVRKGYHETTTREIAQAAGWSVGELYEFVKSKGDILFQVCEVIHEETETLLAACPGEEVAPEEALRASFETYLRACDAWQDVILLIYQESTCLLPELRGKVMASEERITAAFHRAIERGVQAGAFRPLSDREAWLHAHNIVVLGQMWAFRRWYLKKHFTLNDYIAVQWASILRTLRV